MGVISKLSKLAIKKSKGPLSKGRSKKKQLVLAGNKMLEPGKTENFVHTFPGTGQAMDMTETVQPRDKLLKLMGDKRKHQLDTYNKKLKRRGGPLKVLKDNSPTFSAPEGSTYFKPGKGPHGENYTPGTKLKKSKPKNLQFAEKHNLLKGSSEGRFAPTNEPGASTKTTLIRPKSTDWNKGALYNDDGTIQRFKNNKKKFKKDYSLIEQHKFEGYGAREFRPATDKDRGTLVRHKYIDKPNPQTDQYDITVKKGKIIKGGHPQVEDVRRQVKTYKEKTNLNEERSTGRKTSRYVQNEVLMAPIKVGRKTIKKVGEEYSGPTEIISEGWSGKKIGSVVKKIKAGKIKGTTTKIQTFDPKSLDKGNDRSLPTMDETIQMERDSTARYLKDIKDKKERRKIAKYMK